MLLEFTDPPALRKELCRAGGTLGTLTEAESALKAASQLVGVIQGMIQKENPQTHFSFD